MTYITFGVIDNRYGLNVLKYVLMHSHKSFIRDTTSKIIFSTHVVPILFTQMYNILLNK